MSFLPTLSALVLAVSLLASFLLGFAAILEYSGAIDSDLASRVLRTICGMSRVAILPFSGLLNEMLVPTRVIDILMAVSATIPTALLVVLLLILRSVKAASVVLALFTPHFAYMVMALCALPVLVHPFWLSLLPFVIGATYVWLAWHFDIAGVKGYFWKCVLVLSVAVPAFSVMLAGVMFLAPGGNAVGDTAHRFVDRFAYDLCIVEGRDLVWSDRSRTVWRIRDVYRNPSQPEILNAPQSSRQEQKGAAGSITTLLSGRGLLAFDDNDVIVSRKATSFDYLNRNRFAALVRDPASGNLLAVMEWLPRLYWLDAGTWEPLRHVDGWSMGFGTWPDLTLDESRRLAYLSLSLHDGSLFAINLDDFTVTKKLPGLHAYECRMQPGAGELWCIRPMGGDLVAVDLESFRMTRRLRVGPVPRALFIEPSGKAIYTLGYQGDVRRVDLASGSISTIGWTGHWSRRLFVDYENRTIWVASSKGIFRFPITD